MTVPQDYALASQNFDRFMDEVRVRFDHTTRHQAYQTVESALRVFRSRLTLEQIATFGTILPAVLRAIFYEDFDPSQQPKAFTDSAATNAEVRQRRINHEFAPEGAVEMMGAVLKTYVDPIALKRALKVLPPEAAAFWGWKDQA